ncbi:CLUMA_CG013902, isoform A [Clunio marinus]|uniref:Phosphodiesterase n=1 Tax=Clunio marinus TaxID=568069 RepID=A0A1J1ILK9_9DIPT|nr:CLUMA_CG013902, isoform A [Clunio marinus]
MRESAKLEIASTPENIINKTDSIALRDISTESTSSSTNVQTEAQSKNGQISKESGLTIVRRLSGKKSQQQSELEQYICSDSQPPSVTTGYCSYLENRLKMQPTSLNDDLERIDLTTENLPAVDTPDACDKAAIRLRCLLRQLQRGEISAELLQKNLHYAARVLEAVFIDETNDDGSRLSTEPSERDGHNKLKKSNSIAVTEHRRGVPSTPQTHSGPTGLPDGKNAVGKSFIQRRRLRQPVWARSSSQKKRLADEDDELSEVQPDAVPPEVREWLASTFTRQLATTRKKSDEKPKFRSVAHAIRAGIFVDRIYRRVSSTALMQFPPEVVKVLKHLDEWSFDVFALADSGNCMPVKYIGYDLLNRYGMIHKFKVPSATLETFLSRIEEGYCRFRNPYHNNLHAADVAQTVHHVLCQTGLMHWLTDLEIFATLVAALIHDYEHTGTTNNFHVQSGSDTAMLYNDRAVLENHHISAAFRVLKDDDCNILQNLSRDEYRELRTLIIDMVLATDMSFHFQQLKNMKNLLTLAEPSVDKSKALSLVLHCCDISHPAKKWDLHHKWTMLLLEEFFRQGDLERELGLPFSPLCDRNNTLVAESQIGFIEFIVEPSMAVCSDMLEIILAPIAPIANSNNNNSLSNKAISSSSNDEVAANTLNVPKEASSEAIVCEKKDDKPMSGDVEKPTRFKIKKPWVTCLLENKKIWKEQAVKDAEARALAAAEQENEKKSLEIPAVETKVEE